MMDLNWSGLHAEIADSKYAAMSDESIATAINAPGPPVPVPGSYLAEGGILRILGPQQGDDVLSRIESAAETEGNPFASILTRIVRILRQQGGGGIDFGSEETRGMLDQLGDNGVLTAGQVAALKSYGSAPGPSIANGYGFASVSAADVSAARSLR